MLNEENLEVIDSSDEDINKESISEILIDDKDITSNAKIKDSNESKNDDQMIMVDYLDNDILSLKTYTQKEASSFDSNDTQSKDFDEEIGQIRSRVFVDVSLS